MSDSNVILPKSSSSEDEYYKQWTKYRILEEAYNRDKWANRPDSSNKQSSNNITINERDRPRLKSPSYFRGKLRICN